MNVSKQRFILLIRRANDYHFDPINCPQGDTRDGTENCMFVECFHRDWPYVFVVAKHRLAGSSANGRQTPRGAARTLTTRARSRELTKTTRPFPRARVIATRWGKQLCRSGTSRPTTRAGHTRETGTTFSLAKSPPPDPTFLPGSRSRTSTEDGRI